MGPNLEELSIINARLSVTPHTDKHPFSTASMFSKLRKVYFFLVTYLPSALPQRNQAPHGVTTPTGVENPATGYTALHTILQHGLRLETVQVTGCGPPPEAGHDHQHLDQAQDRCLQQHQDILGTQADSGNLRQGGDDDAEEELGREAVMSGLVRLFII